MGRTAVSRRKAMLSRSIVAVPFSLVALGLAWMALTPTPAAAESCPGGGTQICKFRCTGPVGSQQCEEVDCKCAIVDKDKDKRPKAAARLPDAGPYTSLGDKAGHLKAPTTLQRTPSALSPGGSSPFKQLPVGGSPTLQRR